MVNKLNMVNKKKHDQQEKTWSTRKKHGQQIKTWSTNKNMVNK